MSELAYTPRAEYQCDGSSTHYQGCKCHEARHAAEIERLNLIHDMDQAIIDGMRVVVATARMQIASFGEEKTHTGLINALKRYDQAKLNIASLAPEEK